MREGDPLWLKMKHHVVQKIVVVRRGVFMRYCICSCLRGLLVPSGVACQLRQVDAETTRPNAHL